MTAERLQARAEAALQLGRWDDALREAGQMVAADPHDSTGYAMLARALLGKDDYAKAQKAAEDGLAIAPEREWLHRLRCHALRFQKRFDEALAEAETCVQLLPNASESHAVLGKVRAQRKERDEARAAYRRAIALDPQNADYHRDLGDVWLEADPALAEQSYRKALELEPNDAIALNNLGVALNKQKRPKDAALAFKAAILADPSLKVAKENTHATVNGRVGKVVGIGGAAYVLLQFARVAASAGPGAAILAVGAGAAAWFGYRRYRRGKKLEELKAEDPQLHAIFEKLEADKKAGRL